MGEREEIGSSSSLYRCVDTAIGGGGPVKRNRDGDLVLESEPAELA